VLTILVEAGGTSPTLGSTLGFVVGAVINYVLNRRITFSRAEGHFKTAPRFAAVATLGAMLNMAIMYVLTEFADWHYLFCQATATAIVLVFGFLANRFWTFGQEVAKGP
jgi:putative flippase GtrA